METVIKILEDLLYFAEAQIQEGQVAADYQEVGKIAEMKALFFTSISPFSP